MTLGTRLLRLEHEHAAARRAGDRAHRERLAQLFREEGDPRTFDDFGELEPEFQVRWAWLYDAWKTTPAGFIEGELPAHLAPEPGPLVLFVPPDPLATDHA
ncbi:MAG: hypothetical protein ACYC1W_09675 [Gemmatimonadaceae bacterium]